MKDEIMDEIQTEINKVKADSDRIWSDSDRN